MKASQFEIILVVLTEIQNEQLGSVVFYAFNNYLLTVVILCIQQIFVDCSLKSHTQQQWQIQNIRNV